MPDRVRQRAKAGHEFGSVAAVRFRRFGRRTRLERRERQRGAGAAFSRAGAAESVAGDGPGPEGRRRSWRVG
ncbi:MAG: hypothetical protein AVDCRST_MAG08-3780 [uncultured Acetobacteraceae bacterium]|uniref:Uncharacterized protein n=1 Tax=uncultured Acetobacteraceae bacterium TaxID=169975 RepID=A0A6J4JL14_9PROT|nr:MAG: hypothetical protein AVDCRST_MAG08-3780 [uncultured Acetobacteraceae bacterium]